MYCERPKTDKIDVYKKDQLYKVVEAVIKKNTANYTALVRTSLPLIIKTLDYIGIDANRFLAVGELNVANDNIEFIVRNGESEFYVRLLITGAIYTGIYIKNPPTYMTLEFDINTKTDIPVDVREMILATFPAVAK